MMEPNAKFIEVYWKYRRREIASIREFGIALGKCDYFHRGIYARAEKYEASDEYREELEKQIAANPFLRGAITNGECFNEPTRGRKTEKGITEEFKKAYWAYESYLISPDMACEMVGYSKNWFHKISLRYERSTDYAKDLAAHNIQDRPSRTNALPKDFKDNMNLTDKELAAKYKIPTCVIPRMRIKSSRSVWDAINQYSSYRVPGFRKNRTREVVI